MMEKHSFSYGKKQITLYSSGQIHSPLVILNTFSGDGGSVVREMEKINTPACHLLVIGNLDWDHDMTPWYCPAISNNGAPFTGGADEYLDLLLTQIMPQAVQRIGEAPPFIGIAGYSLAGLFALYALYQCDVFERAASMSGSLWFPDFREYVLTHEMKKRPDCLYFSLGDREARTGNPYLKTVQDNTEQIVSYYTKCGLQVTWEMNPGNHFKDPALRSARGIRGILAG